MSFSRVDEFCRPANATAVLAAVSFAVLAFGFFALRSMILRADQRARERRERGED